ncbi:MAG: VWA domain-containing protein [Isosphaera sp.]|nr:VWA domain-containing protein [Isosphaera sp.]
MSAPRQLPSAIVAPEFGEVNVHDTAAGREVLFTVLMEPQGVEAEGWQTGVALDASASMKNWYGRVLVGKVPKDVTAEYERNGWVTGRVEDGKRVNVFKPEAYRDAVARGFMKFTDNIVQGPAREFTAYLAGNLDADGGTTVVYWACGDGSGYEVLGDFTADQCKDLAVTGPAGQPFGTGTRLTPVVRYFCDRFADARRGMYLFLTDGKLDDLAEVKAFTRELCREVEAGRRNAVKCVLIGVGSAVDEAQMAELDDLDTGTGVDVWDHKIHRDMRGLAEIFAEVVDEHTVVAPTGALYDADGNLARRFTDGVPARVAATLPAGCPWFELEVGGQRVRQPLDPR